MFILTPTGSIEGVGPDSRIVVEPTTTGKWCVALYRLTTWRVELISGVTAELCCEVLLDIFRALGDGKSKLNLQSPLDSYRAISVEAQTLAAQLVAAQHE